MSQAPYSAKLKRGKNRNTLKLDSQTLELLNQMGIFTVDRQELNKKQTNPRKAIS